MLGVIDQINLYQAHLRDHKLPWSAKFIAQSAGAFVIVLLGIAASYGWKVLELHRQNAELEHQSAVIAREMGELAQQPTVTPLDPSLAENIARTEETLRGQQQLNTLLQNGVLDDPRTARGYSDHLLALARQHVTGVWLSRITLSGAGHDLTLRGKATAPELVPRYLQNLSHEPVLKGIGFTEFHLSPSTAAPAGTMEFWVATSEQPEEQP